jgi:NAD(P)-dependent dehydrogenase (short-subunit alcohol dehydrogenase family)
MDIKGHAAVVTGGASGLGAATAEELARAGAKVACLDVNLDGARAVAERIGGCAVRCDVTDGEQAAAALAQARDQHGAARILINCAGVGPAKRIVGRDGPMPLADFERVIAINLIGTFNMMRLAAADMQNLSPLADEERGVIISAASVAAFEGQIGQAAYSASKGGVAALTMPAAREFAQFGIRVNAIAPSTRRCSWRCRRRRRKVSPPRCRSPSYWAVPISSRRSRVTSSRTRISTAR